MNESMEPKPTPDSNIDDLLASTDRMLEMVDDSKDRPNHDQPEADGNNFEPPPDVLAGLEAKEQERSKAYDRLDAQARLSNPQIESELAKKGLSAVPTAEELEDREVEEIRSRAHAKSVHEPKTDRSKTLRRAPTRYVSPRDTGPPEHIARQMRDD